MTGNDIVVMERQYGYLKPTGKRDDGINNWRRHFDLWKPMEVEKYHVTFNDPIITVHENKASVDLTGIEKIQRNDGSSAEGFSVVFDLVQTREGWKITRIDEFTDSELHGVD